MSIFQKNDIRGLYPKEWDKETAYRIGFYMPQILDSPKEIVIGRDGRISSDEIFEAICEGITDAGVNVTGIGMCDTPALYFANAFYGFDGSAMITASHNPPDYNGVKISKKGAAPVLHETGIAKLEKLVESKPVPAGKKGQKKSLDIKKDYLKHIEPYTKDIAKVKAIVDCSNGMAGVFANDILSRVHGEFIIINETPDGTFPNHGPNPSKEENLKQVRDLVKQHKADIGLCFDGDADRVVLVDENGKTLSPDITISLLGMHYFKHHPEKLKGDKNVIVDIRCSNSVGEYIESVGGSVIRTPAGHSIIKNRMRQDNVILAGELAGHFYYRDNFFCDSAWITVFLILSVISNEKAKLSELNNMVSKYFISGEINFKADKKDEIIKEVKKVYKDGKFEEMDGIRIDFPTWWFIIRKAGTEPLLRLVVEAKTKEELDKRTAELTNIIKSF